LVTGVQTCALPIFFMFAAMIVVQREPAGPEVIRVPGGRPVAVLAAATGFVVTAISIVLSCVPEASEPDKALFVIKVVGASLALVAIGAVVYWIGSRK